MTTHWRCDTPGTQCAYDTEAAAITKAEELVRQGAGFVVVWECEDGETVPETHEDAPETPVSLPVALGSIRRLFGRQIENREIA
jgi:hypothetical protein